MRFKRHFPCEDRFSSDERKNTIARWEATGVILSYRFSLNMKVELSLLAQGTSSVTYYDTTAV